jgi:hypothetical protein
MRTSNSLIGPTRRHLMSMVEEMKKEEKLSYGVNIRVQIRDGMLSTLIKLNQFKPRDFMRTSDSISIDHSTSDLDSQ